MTFHIDTPLIESTELPKYLPDHKDGIVLLKMDALQPSGSFKIRGIGHLCWKAVNEKNCQRLVTSSGGNAGLAVAYSGFEMGVPVTVIVPESTSAYMRQKIVDFGAELEVYGSAWDDANEKALKLAETPGCAYIHPFDDPDVWEGHTSIIREIHTHYETHKTQPPFQHKPDVIVTVVGGGGLLIGICKALHEVGWQDIPIIASETEGASSFYDSVKEGKLVTLPAINTIAKTLGAKRVASEALEWTKKHQIFPVLVSDKQAVSACLQFADHHRTLVEPSCGAGLAVVYENLPILQDVLKGKKNPTILMIVCGGNAVSLQMLQDWKQQFSL